MNKYVVLLQEGEIHLVPNCRTILFSKNHIGVTDYLLNSLLLGISSHGYVKDILRVLGYNNFMQISDWPSLTHDLKGLYYYSI